MALNLCERARARQGGGGETGLVKPGCEGLGRIIDEVESVLYVCRGVGSGGRGPIFTEETGLLLGSLRRPSCGSAEPPPVTPRLGKSSQTRGATLAR